MYDNTLVNDPYILKSYFPLLNQVLYKCIGNPVFNFQTFYPNAYNFIDFELSNFKCVQIKQLKKRRSILKVLSSIGIGIDKRNIWSKFRVFTVICF